MRVLSQHQMAQITRYMLPASRLLVFLPAVLTTILLFAGTYTTWRSDRPTQLSIGLTSLSMVSYGGLSQTHKIQPPNPSWPDYYFRLHWLPNAFVWECPYCPPENYTKKGLIINSGILEKGPHMKFEPLTLMRRLAIKYHENCDDNKMMDGTCGPFFSAWMKASGFPLGRSFTVSLGFFAFLVFLGGILRASITLFYEFLIAYRPHLMKCRCFMLKRLCPCPKGSPEEIETLDDHFWDGVRVYHYGLTAIYFTAAAIHTTLISNAFVRFLNSVEKYVPKDTSMNIQLGKPFLAMVWSSAAMSLLALGFVMYRRRMAKSTHSSEYRALDQVSLDE